MSPLGPFFAWIRARRLARKAERLERERAALKRSIEYRRARHMPWRPKQGELTRVTCEALAAEIGRDWGV